MLPAERKPGRATERPSGRNELESEFDFRRLDHHVMPLRGLEVFAGAQAEAACEEGAGELADAHVVPLHDLVVSLAGDGDAVFGASEFVLEADEVFVCLQFGVVFRDGEQAAEACRQGGVGFGFRRGGRGSGEFAAGFRDAVEDAVLMCGVALHGRDQVRDQVVASLQLRVDVRPGFVHVLVQGDQAVALGDEPSECDCGDRDYDADSDQKLFHGCWYPFLIQRCGANEIRSGAERCFFLIPASAPVLSI